MKKIQNMQLQQRKALFVRIGALLKILSMPSEERAGIEFSNLLNLEEVDGVINLEVSHNGWFTKENIRQSFAAWGEVLVEEKLEKWLNSYSIPESKVPKNVGLILAGNIPMVGFHDILSVILSGNKAKVKLSRDDARLLPTVMGLAIQLEPQLKEYIEFIPGKLTGFDAVIATGSNNTSRYFDLYFGKVPNIIRKNRSSVAVIQGDETKEELELLGKDVFSYFGLGCRNVTNVMMPRDFNLDRVFEGLFPFKDIVNHNKYANNYDYHKALWLLNNESLLENGFILVKEDNALVSPVGSLFIQRYDSPSEVDTYLKENEDDIQVVVGRNYVPFGQAQCPELWDYADEVDTLSFLSELS